MMQILACFFILCSKVWVGKGMSGGYYCQFSYSARLILSFSPDICYYEKLQPELWRHLSIEEAHTITASWSKEFTFHCPEVLKRLCHSSPHYSPSPRLENGYANTTKRGPGMNPSPNTGTTLWITPTRAAHLGQCQQMSKTELAAKQHEHFQTGFLTYSERPS